MGRQLSSIENKRHISSYKFITIGSLVGLLLGFVIGSIAHGSGPESFQFLHRYLKPVESIWIGTLRLIVLPLITSYLVVAIASAAKNKVAGRIGGVAILTHALLIVFCIIFTLALAFPILSNYEISEAAREVFQNTDINQVQTGTQQSTVVLFDALSKSIAGDLYRAIVGVDIVVLLLVSIAFAVLLTRLPHRFGSPVVAFLSQVASKTNTLVVWILFFMPLIVFSLIFSLTSSIGSEIVGTLGFWLLLVSGFLALGTLLIILVTSVFGHVPISKYLAALGPVYAIAVASRSSLLCLPAMLDSASERLQISSYVSGLVLPLSVSTFKINMMISAPLRFLFLLYLYGIAIDPWLLLTYLLTTALLSFGTPGLPSGSGGFRTLPLYLAAGIPMEGFLLIVAIDAIPDVFKTLINVTEDMSVTTIAAWFSRDEIVIDRALSAKRVD